MSTEAENTYSDWSREELEYGIAAVEAEIIALKQKVEAKAEEARKAQKAKLLEGIEGVKAKLRELGARDTGMRVSKRKRRTKGNRGNVGRKAEEGERGMLIVKLPIRVAADMVEEAQQHQ
jgi:hypothetical protein